MDALTVAGSIAAALIALGTVVRYLIRRTLRAAAWTAAAIRLPAEVERLSTSVTVLSVSVDRLTESLNRHPSNL